MKLLAFSIYDLKVEAYSAPFCCRTYGEAERFFGHLLKEEPQYSKDPNDYHLYCVGTFDQVTGMLEPQAEVKRIQLVEGGS